MAFLSKEFPDIIPTGKEVRLLRQLLQIMERHYVERRHSHAHEQYKYDGTVRAPRLLSMTL